MSTFRGKIQEVPEISIDRFDDANVNSEAFFLSHCHSDHMKGLSNMFFQTLIKNNKFLYGSQISCIILEKMYPFIRSCLRELDLYFPTNIILKSKTVLVTCLPAGHCPGSLMFLFECDKRVLYTGDYRISKNDIKKFKPFYNSLNQVKKIDKIYLDTTFFQSCYPQFPTRDQSLQELCKLIENIIKRGRNHTVNLITGAYYGYEHCFKEVFARTQCPVHVSQRSYEFYSLIPEMDKCVTLDGSTTQIHSNCGDTFKSICVFGFGSIVSPIKITAFRWRKEDLEDGISSFENGTYFVCYSTHASLEEGTELIRFLKPKEIEICVEYESADIDIEMRELLNKLLINIKKGPRSLEKKPSFDSTKMTKKKKLKKSESCDDLGILSSPPRRKSLERTYSVEYGRKTDDGELNITFSQQVNLCLDENMLQKIDRNTSCNTKGSYKKSDNGIESSLFSNDFDSDVLSDILDLTPTKQRPQHEVCQTGIGRDLFLLKTDTLPGTSKDISDCQKYLNLQETQSCEFENAPDDMLHCSQSSEENVLLKILNAPVSTNNYSTKEIAISNDDNLQSSVLNDIINYNPNT